MCRRLSCLSATHSFESIKDGRVTHTVLRRRLQFMSSQSGYHSTEDDFDGPAKSPPRSSPGGAPEEQPGDTAALRSQLQDLTVSSQGVIAYWKAQLEQSKQDMVEILGHAENLSQACEELEDEVANLKAENAQLKFQAGGVTASPQRKEEDSGGGSGDVRSRIAVGLDGDRGVGDPPLLELLAEGGVAQQLTAVSRRIRGEQQRTEEAEADGGDDGYVAEQLSLLGQLLEGAAREMLEQATDLATEKEAHDVTASRLAMLQKKYAVVEMKHSVRQQQPAAAASSGSSPLSSGGGSPGRGSPRSTSRPSRRPRSADKRRGGGAVPLSPNGSNWDETLRQDIRSSPDAAAAAAAASGGVTVDHSRRNSISASRRRSSLGGVGGVRAAAADMVYPSPAPSPVRRRERPPEVASRYRENDSSSGMVPRPQSPVASYQRGGPQRPITAAGGGGGGRSARAGSASRRSRSSSRGRAAAAAGYRRNTAASLSHEPASVSERTNDCPCLLLCCCCLESVRALDPFSWPNALTLVAYHWCDYCVGAEGSQVGRGRPFGYRSQVAICREWLPAPFREEGRLRLPVRDQEGHAECGVLEAGWYVKSVAAQTRNSAIT
eukprot:COSAG06_NODE_3321_length_5508_cov_27.948234_6_plen_605_part_01